MTTNIITNNRECLAKYLAHSECLLYLQVLKHYVTCKRKFHSLEQSDFVSSLVIKAYDGKWKKVVVALNYFKSSQMKENGY